ncbi:DUF1489 family protein [Paracoccaceae bacterium GXU_MW_L88]
MMNIVKLCVGAESIADLARYQSGRGEVSHTTRMFPKRREEVLNGGSLFWVIKGSILARQQIIDLVEVVGTDGIARCKMVLDPEIVRVAPTLKRPFQGWRYLKPADSPPDLGGYDESEDELPPELQKGLAELGIL